MSPRSLKRWISGVLCALTLLLACSFSSEQSLHADNHIIYVNDDATGSNNGSSWANAYTKLQDALVAATPGKEIWVAKGVYYPDEGGNAIADNMYMSFELISEVALYGGFAGTESALSQRNFTTNLTVLSADIDQNDVTDANHIVNSSFDIVGANSLHAVLASDVDSTARLDGFVLTAGLATRHSMYCPEACGGGLYGVRGSPTLANLTVIGNRAVYGAGLLFFGESSPTLTDSLITKNYSVKFAGGLQTQEGTVITVTRVEFVNNSALEVGGGAYINNVDATFNAVTFSVNGSNDNGGGLYTAGGTENTVKINGALFELNNTRNNGGAIYAVGGALEIQDARFEKNGNMQGSGAGIFGKDTDMDIRQSDFMANDSYYDGGALMSENENRTATVRLTDVTMTLNRTGNADGSGGAITQGYGTLKLLRVLINRNSSYYFGGGVSLYSVDATMSNVQFLGNYATPYASEAESFGSGMYLNGGTLKGSNLVFSGNFGTWVGALYLTNDADVELYHTTVADNVATSTATYNTEGIHVDNSSLSLLNSILWDGSDKTLTTFNNSIFVRRFNLRQGSDSADNEGNLWTQTSPFRAMPNAGGDGFGDDPRTELVDESDNDFYGDLRLKPSALAIDAGSNGEMPADLADVDGDNDVGEALPLDLGGAPRNVRFVAAEARVDMGAHEYQNSAPTLVIGGPIAIDEGESVALDATGSTDDGTITGYAWDCTNDGSVDVNEDSADAGACLYADDGNYTLRLTAKDNFNASSSVTTTVTVANVAPLYTPAAAQSAVAGSAKNIELGSFSDPGAEGVWSVAVNWGDGSTEFTTDKSGTLPAKSHAFPSPGTFNVVVWISDGESEDESSFQVTVSAAPPGAPVVTSPASQQASVGSEQLFDLGSFTDAGSSGPWQVTVNWGDGSADTTFEVTSSGQLPAQPHTYGEAGEVAVLVSVSDGALTATMTFTVTIGQQTDGSRVLLPLTRK